MNNKTKESKSILVQIEEMLDVARNSLRQPIGIVLTSTDYEKILEELEKYHSKKGNFLIVEDRVILSPDFIDSKIKYQNIPVGIGHRTYIELKKL